MTALKRHLSLIAIGSILAGCGTMPALSGTAARTALLHAQAAAGTREDKDGWTVIHVAGTPAERGQQMGRLMATEIRGVLKTIAQGDSNYWHGQRDVATKLYAPKITAEYQAEMQGIADGVNGASSKASGDFAKVDYTDILSLNAVVDLMFSDAAGRVMPQWGHDYVLRRLGWDGKHLPCSAFIATGSATADGKIVLGHSTWAPGIAFAKYYNVLVDLTPDQGHRVLYQGLPGTIASNTDWYMNDAGIAFTETTLGESGHYQDGEPVFQRSRKAVQYSNNVEDVITNLGTHNNGDYPNEWLIGDFKTGDIAMFELATSHQAAWRSSKQQWYNGMANFYGGNNYAKDPGVRSELGGWDDGRSRIWADFYAKNKGHIDAAAGRRALGLNGINEASMDGKVADGASMASFTSWAFFGQPGANSKWDALGAAKARL